MTTTNADIIAEKTSYQIFCKKCDYKLTLKNVTFQYANRNVKEYNKLKSVKSATCNHDLAIRET